jgi:glycine/D-amino acid oxidase-like deaminating enzyme
MVETLPVPDLSDDSILRTVSGIRPCRRGGLRIEAERLGADAGGKLVVHNYGHGGCGVTIGLGTGDEVVRLVTAHAEPDAPVAVLGAGAVGLAAALRLLEAGRRVRIIAERPGTETVSVVAGAVWLPTGIEFGDTPERKAWFHAILRRSIHALRGLPERFGVEELPVYEPLGAPEHPEFFDHGSLEPPVPVDPLPVGVRAQPGRVFRTLFMHTPRLLRSLVAEIEARGGVFERRRIERIEEIGQLAEPVAVNCLAMGSRTLFGDDALYPARGMLVMMKPQKLGYIVHDGYKYMFPREDGLVLGGCFLEDDWRDEPDRAVCAEILAHHRAFFGQGPNG